MSLLSTTFTGITLVNPFLLSSAPPTSNRAMISRAFDAGWGGAAGRGDGDRGRGRPGTNPWRS